MHASSRGASTFTAAVLVGLLLLLPVVPAFAAARMSLEHATSSSGFDLGHGFVTVSPIQQVTLTSYWDNFNCPSPNPLRACVVPVGVEYIPPAGIMVLSEAQGICPFACSNTHNALVEIDPVRHLYGQPLPLDCYPRNPFFPGVGNDYFVPCFPSTGPTSILSVDFRTNSIVSNVSDPVVANAMTYDPSNGMMYGGGGNALEAIDPLTGTLESTMHVQNATFNPARGFALTGYTLVFDTATDSLIVPSTTGQLLSVSPGDGTIESTISLPDPVVALAIDPASNLLFASTVSPTWVSSVSVFNARTLAHEATISIPNCVDYSCAIPNAINQILVDPAHGDAYLVGTLALSTLNLSTLSLVGTTVDYGDGSQESAVYVPTTDQVISTYTLPMPGPGLLAQLHHGSIPVLTSLLWLPPTMGIVALVQLVGAEIAAGWVWVRDRRRRVASTGLAKRFGRVPRT
ncbi:MAG: hypothetical protein L3K14_04885 [Thermoplasmata archaeon]|nr:hypothetical protein [Thermoplasmata archaeon]